MDPEPSVASAVQPAEPAPATPAWPAADLPAPTAKAPAPAAGAPAAAADTPAQRADSSAPAAQASVPAAGGSVPGGRERPGRGRAVLVGAAAAVVAMVTTLVLVLELGGGAPEPLPPELAGADPGMVTGWGLPISRLLFDAAGTVTVGTLLATAFLLPAAGGRPGSVGRRMMRAGSVAAWVWCVAALAQFMFTVSDLIGRPLPEALTWRSVRNVLDVVPQPRALLIVAGVTAIVAMGAGVARKLDTAAWLAIGAIVALLPMTMTGHAHGSGGHDLASISGGVHAVGAAAWVGGLVALLVAGRRLSRLELVTAVTRYSRIAGLCLVAVAASGLINAAVRLGGWGALVDSGYGGVVLAKSAALVLLAGFGAAHRRRTIRRVAAGQDSGDAADDGARTGGWRPAWSVSRQLFLRLGAVETAIMAVAVALAAGLSRTPTPVGTETEDPVVRLIGFPMPPKPTVARLFTEIRPDVLFLTFVVLAGWLYLRGVWRLWRGGGTPWPVGRTVCFLLGLAVIVLATSSGLGSYGRVLFSVHMAQHLLLMMIAPILLVLGAPATLALRALPAGVTGTTRSARAWLMRVVNSRYLRFISSPVPAFTLYALSMFVLYLTPIYGWALRYHLSHLAIMVHFLAAGYLFFWVLIGIDPGPHRPSHPARIVMLFLAMAVHAFFGVIVMQSTEVIGASYYELLPRPWGGTLLDDQQLGGGMAWSFGEVPSLFVLAALFFQWARTEERRARASDARMDSGEDDAHEAYNRYLASLHGSNTRRQG